MSLKTYWTTQTEIALNSWTSEFWQSGRDNQLAIACCTSCGLHRLPPLPYCKSCLCKEIEWRSYEGELTLYSFTLCAHPEGGQYAPALVEAGGADNVRLIGNLIDMNPEDIQIGMKLTIEWLPIANGYKYPAFKKA
jgi:uncharacterized OB-fold protein